MDEREKLAELLRIAAEDMKKRAGACYYRVSLTYIVSGPGIDREVAVGLILSMN